MARSESRQPHLSKAAWTRVVLIAGLGTVLEWFDFYIYTQLSSTISKVFFPTEDETAQALAYWGSFALGFCVRPAGALLFGHIGDTAGRNKTLRIAIMLMAIPTFIIGCLPTYGTVSSYYISPPILAPIMLCICRLVQGLAMGGEFGSAVIYISELASPDRRGLYVAALQCTVNIGMALATILVMILDAAIDDQGMLEYGWRIPFLLAFCTALLGFVLRRGMPEPHTFLSAARAEKAYESDATAGDEERPSIPGVTATLTLTRSGTAASGFTITDSVKNGSEDATSSDDEDANEPEGVLASLHGNSHSKTPISRLVRNNWLGVICQVLFMAWVSGAFYLTVSWLMATLKKSYGMAPLESQGLLLVSLLFNAAGLLGVGHAYDRGMRAIYANAVCTVVGVAVSFGVFYGVTTGTGAAWCLVCLQQLIVGAAMAIVVLPCTRIYDPLERTTGFSFGYNCGYGVIGGLSPIIVTAIQTGMDPAAKILAPAYWLFTLGGAAALGCALLVMYDKKINRRKVGHIE